MPVYAVTLEFNCTIGVEADSLEEAETKAAEIDATEVLDDLSLANVVHVEAQ